MTDVWTSLYCIIMQILLLLGFLFLNGCSNTLKIEFIKKLDDLKSGEVFSGASALVWHQNSYFIVRDNSNAIYQFDKDFNLLKEIAVFEGKLPQDAKQRKKQKPDLEAAVIFQHKNSDKNELLLIPSGSKKNRYRGRLVLLEAGNTLSNKIRPVDFSNLYDFLKEKVGKVNIEGAVTIGDQLLFFQRGNSKNAKNAMIVLNKNVSSDNEGKLIFSKDQVVEIIYPELGTKNGTPYTFTDAILYNESQILFLAAAEETEDAFFDGDVSGMIVGLLDLKGDVLWKKELSENIKLEGIAILSLNKKSDSQLELLTVSDADSDNTSSALYKIFIDLI